MTFTDTAAFNGSLKIQKTWLEKHPSKALGFLDSFRCYWFGAVQNADGKELLEKHLVDLPKNLHRAPNPHTHDLMCATGLISHQFHIISDHHQPHSRNYIYIYNDFPLKVG